MSGSRPFGDNKCGTHYSYTVDLCRDSRIITHDCVHMVAVVVAVMALGVAVVEVAGVAVPHGEDMVVAW